MVTRYTNRVVTRWYRCPELLLGETNYGLVIDMWSIGCVFWELITGEVLFFGNDEKEVFLQICKKCGTPSEEEWPEMKNLKQYNNLYPQKNFEGELNFDIVSKKYNKF